MRGRCDWRFSLCYSHLIWARPDVLGSFLLNAGPFSNNVGLSGPLFSANVGPKPRMFSGRAVYVFRSLHLAVRKRTRRKAVLRGKHRRFRRITTTANW
jgi:hypothetical protein